ncbi:MAG: DUF6285 domain-containing protein [Parvularculales bacterium]
MQDQPSLIELVNAVQTFLRSDAAPALSGQKAFHALVAANVLAIVERELSLAPQGDEQELARLKALLNMDGDLLSLNKELCQRIADGRLTMETPGLIEHLQRTTETKVAIDQPRYSRYKRILEKQNGRD